MLRHGGNAVDAAVAVAFALAVTHPSAGNIGGGGFMLVRLANGETHAIDFRETAPAAATLEKNKAMLDAGGLGYASAGVPGTVAGMTLALEKWGTRPLAELVAPAIGLAKKGHKLGARQTLLLLWSWPKLRKDPVARALWGHDKEPLKQGDLIKQPDLARTLEAIARDGRKGFYEGHVAAAIDKAMRAHGGLVTAADLAAYEARLRAPLRFDYRGFTVETMPPPSMGGVAFAEIMLALERQHAWEAPVDSGLSLHLFVEAARRAYAERRLVGADPDALGPDGGDALLAKLLGGEHLTTRKPPIDPDHATPSTALVVGLEPAEHESPETTHFSIVDAQGNAVSCTYTQSASFGSKVVIPGTGVLLANAMGGFSPAGPNVLTPGHRMASSMTPTIVSQSGKLALVLGSPGGDTIPGTVAQVLRDVVDGGMTIDEAVEHPRVHHAYLPDRVRTERALPIPKAVVAELQKRGHTVQPETMALGDANEILVDVTGGGRGGRWIRGRGGGRRGWRRRRPARTGPRNHAELVEGEEHVAEHAAAVVEGAGGARGGERAEATRSKRGVAVEPGERGEEARGRDVGREGPGAPGEDAGRGGVGGAIPERAGRLVGEVALHRGADGERGVAVGGRVGGGAERFGEASEGQAERGGVGEVASSLRGPADGAVGRDEGAADDVRGEAGAGEGGGVARRLEERDEGRDGEAVLVRVDVVVDARQAEGAALAVAEAVVDVAVDEGLPRVVRAGVRVLAHEEGALGAGEERAHVARDAVRVRQERGVPGALIGARIRLQVRGLEGHELLVVRLVPRRPRRVLVDPSPHRIEERALLLQREDGPLERRHVAVRRAGDLQLDVGAERRLLPVPPAALGLVVVGVEIDERAAGDPPEGGHRRGDCADVQARGRRLGALLRRRLRLREHAAELVGREVAAVLADLLGVRRKDDGRRPAPRAVALGEVGVLVDVDADGDEAIAQEAHHLGVAIRGLVHHVAPVAPLGRSIEEDELLVPARLGERLGRPRVPGEGGRRAARGARPRDVHRRGSPRAHEAARSVGDRDVRR